MKGNVLQHSQLLQRAAPQILSTGGQSWPLLLSPSHSLPLTNRPVIVRQPGLS